MTNLRRDWTQNKEGRSNSSKLYNELVAHVARLIRNSSYDLIGGSTDKVATVIVSTLVHYHCLAPEREIDILERDDLIDELRKSNDEAKALISRVVKAHANASTDTELYVAMEDVWGALRNWLKTQ